jgi:hypothetical protein
MLVHSNGGYMDVDLSYQLGFVHGLRSLGISYQWMSRDYIKGYAKGTEMKRLHLLQEENYVKRSGHQGLRQATSDTAVLSEA